MATKPASSIPTPLTLIDASAPMADTPGGGKEFAFRGISEGKKKKLPTQPDEVEPAEEQDEFAGMGPWLEDDDATVFQRAQDLVLRQELIAQSRLALDQYFTYVKLGYPFATLTKDPNKSMYRCELPAGSRPMSISAVPNQAWDLVNKATEAILADPPQPDPSPLNDSEEAQAAAEMAERFLTEDGGENGTNDIALLYSAVDGALSSATRYIEGWVDPVGGGYVPLQILAHPQAPDANQPLIGPDGMPTPNPVLRYVADGPDGQLAFTENAADAKPQWQPKIRGTVWNREHWRLYPETATVETAYMAIGLLYCTLGEAKRRWPSVAAMDSDELSSLLDWTPPRYLVLLPPFQRSRWAVSSGSDKQKAGSSDERILFYYRVLVKADPEHLHGAEVIVTGAQQGRVLNKQLLGITLESGEVRCMDLLLAQVTPRADPDEKDPTGRAYMQLFVGATEADAALRVGMIEALDQWLHPDSYIYGASTVQGYQVQESRQTGDAIPIMRPEDKPTYGNQPPIPAQFFQWIESSQGTIRSIASLDKAVTGQEDPTKESGKALQLAMGRALVGLARMNHPVNAAIERWWRIKLQLAMRDYSTPQMVRYVGEDGAYKSDEFKGIDFALVGSVGVQAGTGTMMPPEQKVQYLANVVQARFLDPAEAADAARQTFAQRLGLPDDPHKQYVERAIALWLDGPPEPQLGADGQPGEDWTTLWQTYMQQRQQYNEFMVQFHQQQQAKEQADAQNAAQEAALAPERVKADSALKVEHAKHTSALEQKRMELEHQDRQAKAAKEPPPPPRPTRKTTTIRKNPDGTMTADTTEAPADEGAAA